MKKRINILLIICLILVMDIYIFAADYDSNINSNEDIQKLTNIEMKHNTGTLLCTETTYKNGQNIIKKGKNVISDIKIENSILEGCLECNSIQYQLEGSLDIELGKYIGKVINKDNYTFETYLLNSEDGSILVNIFDENNKPQSFLIDGSKAKKEYIEINEKVGVLGTEKYAELLSENRYIDGFYIKATGPNPSNGGAVDSAWIRTKSDDAWEESGLDNYHFKYSCYVSDLEIEFEPYAAKFGAQYTPNKPICDGKTYFSIPVYLGSIIGTQLIPIKTSSTHVYQGIENVIVTYDWSLSKGYLDEYDDEYDDKKSFGASVIQHYNGKGNIINKISVDITYGCIAAKNEYSNSVTAYPCFEGELYYGREVE